MRDRIFIILDSKKKKLLDYYDDGIFIFEKYFILIYLKININMTFLFLITSYYITLRLSCKIIGIR